MGFLCTYNLNITRSSQPKTKNILTLHFEVLPKSLSPQHGCDLSGIVQFGAFTSVIDRVVVMEDTAEELLGVLLVEVWRDLVGVPDNVNVVARD